MKSVRVSTKALLAFIVTLILAVSFSVTAFAAERYENCGNRYGRIIPTDEKLDAQVFDYYFKGDSAPIHFMRMSTGEPGACYAVEIYADAEYTNLIKYLSREYDTTAGHSPVAISLSFDGLRSGTYYGRCYTYVTRSDGTIYDLDSIQNFNIHIDRLSNKTVVLSSAYNTDAGISVNWNPNATASQYHVYRKVNGYGDWAYIATLGEGAYNYLDTDVVNGETYTYTVSCSDGGYWSGYDANGVSVTRLTTPELINVAIASPTGDVQVNWQTVYGADGYYIYRKGGSLSNYDWQLIGDVRGGYSNSYVDVNAKSISWCYNYTIVAYKNNSVSSYNPVGLEFNYLTAPSLTTTFSCDGSVYIEWTDSNRNTLGYNVFRKVFGGNWEFIATTTDKYFIDSTVVSGVDYAYTVVAYCATNESAYNNDGIAIRYVATPQINEVSFDEHNTTVITWNHVGGAEKYQVFRKLSHESDWTFIGETYESIFYDGIEKYSGETYTYTVIANSGIYGSAYGTAGKTGYFLSAPAVNTYNSYLGRGTTAVQIDWSQVNGATSYDVYRSDYGVGNWICIAGGVTGNSFVDYTANSYYGYDYTVIAVNDYAQSKFNISPLYTLPTPVLEYAVLGNEGGVHLGWTAMNDGVVYHIYRRAIDGAWVEIGTSNTNYFFDWSEEAVNQHFIYTVVAEIHGFVSAFDGLGIANFTEVRNLNGTLTDGENPYVTINWQPDGFAQWYELTKTVNGQTVSLGVFAGDSGVTQYVDTDVVIGNVYTYSITAGCEGRFTKTNTVEVKYPLPPVPATQIGGVNAYESNGKACVDIVWGFVDYAEVYTIFRRTEGSDWTPIATVSLEDLVNGPNYTDTTAEFDVTYYYTVVGYADNRESLYDDTGVAVIILKPVSHPYGVTVREDIINSQTVAVVGWDAVDKAGFYSVFRKTDNSDWVYLGTNWDGTCSFVDYSITQGVKYTYTVSAGATGRGEALNPVGATYRWNINDVGIVPAGYTGVFEYLGTWYYFENGRINWNSNLLVNHDGRWLYALSGEVAWDYTGLAKHYDDWFYVENGVLNPNATTLVQYDGDWYYVVDGYLNRNITTLVLYDGNWYYVENGVLNWNSNTLVNYADAWFYVRNGQIAWDYTGLVKYYDDWFYVENGVLNPNATTLVQYDGDWYYVVDGYLNRNITTLVLYDGNWYYVENGVLNWNSNTLVNYADAWFYVRNGQIAWDYTGLVSYYNDWYYIENGVLNWNISTLVLYDGNWYYVENGYLNWNSEAIVEYQGAQYYILGGQIAWGYSGDVIINNLMYRVKDGIVTDFVFDLNPVY